MSEQNPHKFYASPILFSADMVNALIAGRKTQTRRIITSQWQNVKTHFELGESTILWVREKLECANGEAVGYPANRDWLPNTPWQWKRQTLPAIHMPRWLSRLCLKVTAIRKENVQDMRGENPSLSDVLAEGINEIQHTDGNYYYSAFHDEPSPDNHSIPEDAFSELWDSLHGNKPGEAWKDDPEVYVFTFEVIQKNIDALILDEGLRS